VNGKINSANGETKNKETLSLGFKLDGVLFEKPPVPTGDNPDWMTYITDLVNLFDKKALEQFKKMDEFKDANPIPTNAASFNPPLNSVAFFAARIKAPLTEWNPDLGAKISAQLSEAGELLIDVTYLLGRLNQQKDIFEETDDTIFQINYGKLWLPNYVHWSDFLISERNAIFDYIQLSNLELYEGNIPPPRPLNATTQTIVQELIGNGIISPIVIKGEVIKDLVWHGFVVDGQPFWKGKALCLDKSYDVTTSFWELEGFITVDQCVPNEPGVEIQSNAKVFYFEPGENFFNGGKPTVLLTAYTSSSNSTTQTADKAIDRKGTGDGDKTTSVFSNLQDSRAWFYIDVRRKDIVDNPNEPNTQMWQLSNTPQRITKIEIDRKDAATRQGIFGVTVVNWSNPPQDSPDKYGAFKPECSNTIGPNGGFDGVQGTLLLCQGGGFNGVPHGAGKGTAVWREAWTESVVPFTTTHIPDDGTRGQYVVVEMFDGNPLYISDIRIFSDEIFFDPPVETFAPTVMVTPQPTPQPTPRLTPRPTPVPRDRMGFIKDISVAGRNLNLCEGDCDRDSDCSGDLICFHKAQTRSQDVPSCLYPSDRAGYSSNWDYCTHSRYRVKKQSRSTGLDICDGNCSRNSDCSGDLICYKDAIAAKLIPGCTFLGEGGGYNRREIYQLLR